MADGGNPPNARSSAMVREITAANADSQIKALINFGIAPPLGEKLIKLPIDNPGDFFFGDERGHQRWYFTVEGDVLIIDGHLPSNDRAEKALSGPEGKRHDIPLPKLGRIFDGDAAGKSLRHQPIEEAVNLGDSLGLGGAVRFTDFHNTS